MKNFVVRILLAASMTVVAFVLSSSAQAQQADEDRTPAAPRQAQSPAAPQAPQKQGASAAPGTDAQTQDALAFSGRVMKEQGQLVLKDPVTKMSYQLDDQAKAKPYLGKQVKITGKLEMKSNTIHIEGIEPLS
jgi:nucleoid-associated protein YgaU